MRILILALCLSFTIACHPPSSLTTQQGKTAYTVDQIVQRVNELENTAIAANSTGGLPANTTRVIVEFCVKGDQTLAAVPNGWQATISAAWAAAKTQVGMPNNPAVAAAMGAVDAALAALGGGQ